VVADPQRNHPQHPTEGARPKSTLQVWTPEGSPLKVHTERQAKLLRGYLGQAGHRVVVDYAMRYGQPSIPATLSRLKAEGCTRILLLPLYPQYAASTTASAIDAACRLAAARCATSRKYAASGVSPTTRATSLRWPPASASTGRPMAIRTASYRLLMSFHGLPRYTLDRGDPYHCECHKTAACLPKHWSWRKDGHQICFQSRFGRTEWLQPYTAARPCARWARQGVQRVDVICPGFPADCLETLEEIAIEGKSEFMRAGGKEYHYIPCLNERDDWIHALADLAASHLQGWPTREASPDAAASS
jgi:ferrochelatase